MICLPCREAAVSGAPHYDCVNEIHGTDTQCYCAHEPPGSAINPLHLTEREKPDILE